MSAQVDDLKTYVDGRLELRDSRIDGRGLFTREPVSELEILIRFGGRLFLLSDRFGNSIEPGTAVGVTDDILLASPVGERDMTDFINHSCRPTVGMSDAITLVALRPMAAGEEITVDYAAWEAHPEYRMKRDCACGSPNCRHIVTGNDWRHYESLPHLKDFASPFIRRRIEVLRSEDRG